MTPLARRRRIPVAALCACFGLLAASPAVPETEPPPSEYTARIDIDLSARASALQPELFGVNANWVKSGNEVIEFGEMIRDRSFRNQAGEAERQWIESPNKETDGRIECVGEGGHDKPWGGKGHQGYLRLSQERRGYTCVSQLLIGNVVARERYELHVSANGEHGQPALSVFFVDGSFMPIEELDNVARVKLGVWSDYSFVLEPTKSQAPGLLRICLVTEGAVGIDEVRLRRLGGPPRVKRVARQAIRELGARSLRWPAGTDADFFDWRESIGLLRHRGENVTTFGARETASFGLHEFLDFCEAEGIVALVTVNVCQAPDSAADLVEYVLGPASSPMGALRAKHGRGTPWDVKHFELGNEPTDNYRAGFESDLTAKGYVELAEATSVAMRARAKALGRSIELKAVIETTFALADWIELVPLLAKWNGIALSDHDGLRQHSDQVKGHFYSFFSHRESERELFEEVMGGGATLARTLREIEREHGRLPPFWLTEYGIMVQKSNPTEILTDRLKDYQSGLATADLMMAAVQEGFGGAYLFTLAERATWGVLRNDADFCMRPSGLAFSMFSGLSGKQLLPVKIEGGDIVTLKGRDGNNPSNMRYSTLAALASCANGSVQVIILNRSYDRNEQVWVNAKDLHAKRVVVERLESSKLTDHNEDASDRVRIVRGAKAVSDHSIVSVGPRSLVRLLYLKD